MSWRPLADGYYPAHAQQWFCCQSPLGPRDSRKLQVVSYTGGLLLSPSMIFSWSQYIAITTCYSQQCMCKINYMALIITWKPFTNGSGPSRQVILKFFDQKGGLWLGMTLRIQVGQGLKIMWSIKIPQCATRIRWPSLLLLKLLKLQLLFVSLRQLMEGSSNPVSSWRSPWFSPALITHIKWPGSMGIDAFY